MDRAAIGLGVVALVSAGFVAWVVVRREPGSWVRGVATFGVKALLAVAALFVLGAMVRHGRWIAAASAALCVVAVLLAPSVADQLHWRWTRDVFDRVAAGESVACPDASQCRLGWWTVTHSERRDGFTIIWALHSAMCDAGRIAAKADGPDPGRDAVGAALLYLGSGSSVSVLGDGWYDLCLQT